VAVRRDLRGGRLVSGGDAARRHLHAKEAQLPHGGQQGPILTPRQGEVAECGLHGDSRMAKGSVHRGDQVVDGGAWHTRADNAAARRLYDRFVPVDGFVRYALALG